METAKLVLEYVKAVAWPTVFLLVMFRYRTEVRSFWAACAPFPP
ncbi:hypothetical protein [Streptomyces sp. NPDC047108]